MRFGSTRLHGSRRISRATFVRAAGGGVALLALSGTLAACGSDDSSGSGGGGSENASIRVIAVADQKPALDPLVAAYERANPGSKVTITYAPTDQVQTSVRTQLGAGNAPDVHVVYPGSGSAMSMAEIARAGLLADLDDQPWTRSIPTSLDGAYKVDGRTYLYSAGSSVIGAIYNRRTFDDAGVQLPTTWSELLRACDTFKSRGIVPIALGAQTPWVTQLIDYALVPSTVYARDPRFDDDQLAGRATFADSGWREAMEKYLQLQRQGCFNDNPNGTTFEQQTSLVGTGRAAMAVQVSAVLAGFRDAAARPDEISMFPLPGAENAADNWIPAGVVVGLGVSARSKNLDAAKRFVAFLGEPANTNRWASSVAAIPLARDASTRIDPALESFLPYIDDDKAVPFMDQRWPNPEVQPTHFAVVQELLSGKTDVDGALQKMDEAYKKQQ
jgi:raffinose/stachyose/melibiose transport system substrate-binding protein